MPGICRKVVLSLLLAALLAVPTAAAAPDSTSQTKWFAGYVFWRLTIFGVVAILGGTWGYFKGLFVRPAKTRAELELEAEAEADADRYRY
jgi:hypothetical protein